jgi:hypothetical protein
VHSMKLPITCRGATRNARIGPHAQEILTGDEYEKIQSET